MTRFTTRGVLRTAVACLLAGAAVAAGGPATAGAATLRQQADTIMNKDYVSFVNYKKSVLSKAGPYTFDWTDNGCSAPYFFLAAAAAEFNAPCQLHDFGYRNYGAGFYHLSVTESTRLWIDQRFLAEMRRRCVDKYVVLSARNDCYSWANGFYNAVRSQGADHFFG